MLQLYGGGLKIIQCGPANPVIDSKSTESAMGSIKTQLLLVIGSCVMGVIAYVPPPPAQVFVFPGAKGTTSKSQETLLEKHNNIEKILDAVNMTLSNLSEKVETIEKAETAKDAELSSELKSMSNQQQTFQEEIRKSVSNGAEKDEELKSSLNSMKTKQEEFEKNISQAVDEAVAKDDELSSSLVSITSGQNDFRNEISKSVEDVVKKDEEIVSSLSSMKTEQEEFNENITKAVEDGDSKVSDIEAETGRIRTTQTGLIKKLDQLNTSLAQMVNQLSTELNQDLQAQEAVDERLESMVEEVKKQLDDLVSNADTEETPDVTPKPSKGRPGGIRSCLEIKECLGSRSRDAEYWIYPSILGGKKIKVWCNNMAGTPQEYITLPEDNEGEFPNKQNLHCSSRSNGGKIQGNDISKVGKNRFKRIKVDIDTMVVDRSDRTFARTEGKAYPYGYAGDCYSYHYGHKSSCGTKGYFKIDTRETGLRIKPSLKWKLSGYLPFGEVKRSEGNAEIRVRCGGGCGWCEPEGDMVLEINPSDDVNDDDDDDDDDDVIVVPRC
ncbi:uncharacterized protein [Haliotis asinina]|uniref:uncharacterized protein n=1 Tax=Haliotis asinina TaxID=109174 RepID=UPI0035327D10